MTCRVFGSSRRLINLSISADVANVNLYTLASSPATAVDVVVQIQSGIYVYSATANAALDTGIGWAVGSTIKLVNLGGVVGSGGNGNGGTGHNAINLQYAMAIDNVGGVIFGGGGGGARGPADGSGISHCDGGGGGGGQGRNGGTGGATLGSDGGATAGSAGSFSAAGNGGGGGSQSFYGTHGGDGGRGGKWGQPGLQSGLNSVGSFSTTFGQPGLAVKLNGHTVTWISGNDSTHVKGAVA